MAIDSRCDLLKLMTDMWKDSYYITFQFTANSKNTKGPKIHSE